MTAPPQPVLQSLVRAAVEGTGAIAGGVAGLTADATGEAAGDGGAPHPASNATTVPGSGATILSSPTCSSVSPPNGSISVPSPSRAMALIVRSRRPRSSSSVTSGAT